MKMKSTRGYYSLKNYKMPQQQWTTTGKKETAVKYMVASRKVTNYNTKYK
jgi:hypothetical protein